MHAQTGAAHLCIFQCTVYAYIDSVEVTLSHRQTSFQPRRVTADVNWTGEWLLGLPQWDFAARRFPNVSLPWDVSARLGVAASLAAFLAALS